MQVNFNQGDQVLLKTHPQSSVDAHKIKKCLKYKRPFMVLRKAGSNSYIASNDQGVVLSQQNVVNLKLYKTISPRVYQ